MKFFSGRGFSRTAAIAAAMTCASTTLALNPPAPHLKLVASDSTLGVGQKLEVAFTMVGAVDAAGAQFVIRYDKTKLALDGVDNSSDPDVVHPYYCCPGQYLGQILASWGVPLVAGDPTGAQYVVALGTQTGNDNAHLDGTIATISFTCLEQLCDASNLVSFSSWNGFSSKLSDATGNPVTLGSSEDLGAVTRMVTNPSMTAAPANRSFWADANGSNKALVELTDPTAMDACGNAVIVTNNEPSGNLYPAGVTTTATYSATDSCGNPSQRTTLVDVSADSLLLAKVGMAGAFDAASFERGIIISASGAGTDSDSKTVTMAKTGSAGSSRAEGDVNIYLAGNVEWEGSCAEIRDPKHSLRSAVSIGAESGAGSFGGRQYNSRYNADAKAAPADMLVVGNINGDTVIDILDFGTFVAKRGLEASVNTDASAGVHADLNASGLVDNVDLSFLAVNFFKVDETCSSGFASQRPLARIKVSQLRAMGLGDQASADINGDGWVDTTDMSLMMQGAQPRNTAKKPVIVNDAGPMAP